MQQTPWRDTPARYGRISRALHWGMAALLAWQFAGMAVRLLVGRSPLTAFMVGSHMPVGTLLLALALGRVAWALSQARRRPRQGGGAWGLAARLGHGLLYALLLTVPALGLLRAYGGGRAFAPFGLPLFGGFPGGPVAWMVAPANAVHGLLAWGLLALVAGHVAMVAGHRYWWRDDVLHRMAGRPHPAPPAPERSPAA